MNTRIIVLSIAAAAGLGLLQALSPAGHPFLTRDNLLDLARQVAVVGIMAVGMTLVIVRGGIDISVGSMLGAVAMACGWALAERHASPALVVPGAILLGGLLGLVNALAIRGLGIPPIITTLGTLTIYRGMTLQLAYGMQYQGFPESFRALAGVAPGTAWLPLALLVAFLLGAELFARRTAAGRALYYVGNNEKAARIWGLSVGRADLLVYTVNGLLVGLAGAVLAARVGNVDPNLGRGYEMDVIGAVVLGGTRITGGEGSIAGSVLGTLVLTLIQPVLVMLGTDPEWSKVIVGALILAVVGLDVVAHRMAEDRERRARAAARASNLGRT